MTTLKDALKNNKLAQFIKDHAGEQGDSEKFNRTISSMVGQTKKEVPAASPEDSSES